MLSQFEKVNLSKVLEKYSFEQLRPPPSVYSIQIPESEYFTQPNTESARRRIYYNVPYDTKELKIISEIKNQLKQHNIHEKINDELILKHAYMSKFDIEKVVERLKDTINYHRNPIVTVFNQNTISRLASGAFYTYGCDKGMRPIIVARIDRINFEQPFECILNSYYYMMLIIYAYRLVPYHAEKITFIADLRGVSLSSLPIFSLYDQMKKIGVYYCGSTERTLLYNSSGIGFVWNVVGNFLTQSQKKKLIIIPKGQEEKALDFIDPHQLQTQYGGKLPSLTKYWPPVSPKEDTEQTCRQDFESDYFSVENNLQFFSQTHAQHGNCCGCSCTIY